MPGEVPESKWVFQAAAWMWLAYLAALAIIDTFIYANRPISPIFWYHFINGIPAIIFLGLSYSKWIKSQAAYLAPVMVLLITAAPILGNYLFDLHLPPAPLSNLEGMILRQLPILFIGLVLVAWHYQLVTMVLYSLLTNLFEWAVVLMIGRIDQTVLNDFYFIMVIRTVCLIVVGVFVNQLISYLRAQRESLKSANSQLTHYASTLESLTLSRERNRMSRELHDTVVHTLSGLSVQLETAKVYLDVDPETSRRLVGQSLETTRSGLQETRRAIKALRASPLDDLGLVSALLEMVKTAAERGKLSLDYTLPDQILLLSPDIEQAIFRICQEAVENVVHHARAKHLAVKLSATEEGVLLVVQDDGIGFDPESGSPTGHFGLKGMQERAQLAGGIFSIQSKPSFGTTIQLAIKGPCQ